MRIRVVTNQAGGLWAVRFSPSRRFAEEICHDCALHEAHCTRGRIARALLHVGCSADDPLPSWNDGSPKQAIVDFVKATTDSASPKFVPHEERIATMRSVKAVLAALAKAGVEVGEDYVKLLPKPSSSSSPLKWYKLGPFSTERRGKFRGKDPKKPGKPWLSTSQIGEGGIRTLCPVGEICL